MPVYRLSEAAALLGVSDDTLRRWADQGRVTPTTTPAGAAGIDGRELAALAADRAHLEGAATSPTTTSARNRLRGIVTDVTRDTVMAQVELCCGPYRVVSLMSREAADALGLQPGVVADAVVKATTVVVETP
ncbi:MAG: binding domain protein excisionase family [Nocardioidaceae bacterium]|jgi:molybdopterin-binding protein|nr:binding domain protein excisionase family [Nocardioidaceae bacterium]